MTNHNVIQFPISEQPAAHQETNDKEINDRSLAEHRIKIARIVGLTTTAALSILAPNILHSHDAPAEKPPTTKEQILTAIHEGPDAGAVTHVIKQDQATSTALESYASEFASAHNITFLEGQNVATLVSSQEIERSTREATGGTVQPGDTIDTWTDDKTGFIVSAPHESVK